jgi:hydroxymethylbilane synthase
VTALRLATRGSPLALAQTARVSERLAGISVDTDVVVVDTEGDRQASTPLVELAGRGVFVKEVQAAVLDGRADVAVHSAKDLPPTSPEGLVLASVPERADPADALVGSPLLVLGPGATVATGAPRRRALLLAERPDLRIVALRGNVATRLAALGRNDVQAVVVAVAALERLGLLDRVAQRLDPDRFVPQVGQGAIALECAAGTTALELVARIDDEDAHRALLAERAFLEELGAGCELPGGALAEVRDELVTIRGVLLSTDGAVAVRGVDADVDAARAGRMLAARLRSGFDRASDVT